MPQTPDQHPAPSPEAVARGHEPDRLRISAFVWFAVGFVAFAIAAHLAIWYLLRGYTNDARPVDRARSVVRADSAPPPGAPPLQPTPEHDVVPWQDVAEMRAGEDRVFAKIGWAVKDGRAQIPDSVVHAVAQRATSRTSLSTTPTARPAGGTR